MSARPWVEKYRPKRLEDVAHQTAAVDMLKGALEAQSLPHMLFYGPPGTGKTTVALVLARRLFGTAYKERVLELNASDDRGINAVRTKIKNRARLDVANSEAMPAFQLIILDEADCMTTDAQRALLRTVEVFSSHTRFIILCNYVSRMISPLVSRCARIRFQSLPPEVVQERLCYICDTEGVELDEEGALAIAQAARGDLRRAIMILHSAVRMAGPDVTLPMILEVSGNVPEEVLEKFESKSFASPGRCYAAVQEIVREGYAARQILLQLADRVLRNAHYNDIQKAEVFEAIAEADAKLSEGASEALQLLVVGSALARASDSMMID